MNFPARLSAFGNCLALIFAILLQEPSAAESSAAPAASASAVAAHEEIRALARKGLLDSAFQVCHKVLEANPADAFALLMAGKLSPEGKSSGEFFKKAIKAGGTSPEAEESYFRLGQYYYAAGKYYQAIPSFRDYQRLFPNGDWKDPALYWMGNACLSYAQTKPVYLDSALTYFDILYKEQKPDEYYYPLALEGLAKTKAALGDREGANVAAKAALEKAPEEERGALLLLSAQLRQGMDREEEKKAIERLMSQYPQSPEARYLRKLNAGLDPARWKSGTGLPKAIPPAAKDSMFTSGPANANAANPGNRQGDSTSKATVTSTVPSTAANGHINSAAPGDKGLTSEKGVTGEKGFTLQLGAFSQAINAQAMVANLIKLGFKPEMLESTRSGKRFYQVRLGRFASPEEASEYARTNLKPHQLLSQPVPLSP